jgi:hypothetical protein
MFQNTKEASINGVQKPIIHGMWCGRGGRREKESMSRKRNALKLIISDYFVLFM